MNPLYLAGHVLKAQQQNQFRADEDAFLASQQQSHTAARRALISIAASLGGFVIFAAALQSFS